MRIVLAAAAVLHVGSPGMAAEISIMSGGAPKEVLATLIPRFEKLTGHGDKAQAVHRILPLPVWRVKEDCTHVNAG